MVSALLLKYCFEKINYSAKLNLHFLHIKKKKKKLLTICFIIHPNLDLRKNNLFVHLTEPTSQ